MAQADPPSITVVIPTFRRPRLLARALASVTAQEGVRVRAHVFDNASGDGTADVVAAAAEGHPDVLYHCHPRNLGAAANFLFALESVSTPYFSILSDDDYLLPGFHQAALQGLESHPEAMFWAGATLCVDECNRIWDARVLQWPREGLYLPPEGVLRMTGGLAPTWTGIVFRREVLATVGLPDPEVQGPADLDFVLKAASRYPFVLSKAPCAVFTLNPASFSGTQPLGAFWPGWQRMLGNIAAWPDLDAEAKAALTARLHADARKMLFRRGAAALAGDRLDFAREAADALEVRYSERLRAGILRVSAWACGTVPGMQGLYSAAYRLAERRIVRSRRALQVRFGHLLREPA